MKRAFQRDSRALVVRLLAGSVLVAVVVAAVALTSRARSRMATGLPATAEDSRATASPGAAGTVPSPSPKQAQVRPISPPTARRGLKYQPRRDMDTSGFFQSLAHLSMDDRRHAERNRGELADGRPANDRGARSCPASAGQVRLAAAPDLALEGQRPQLRGEGGRGLRAARADAGVGRAAGRAGRARSLHRHLLPGGDRDAARRDRELRHVPRRELVHHPDRAGRRPHQPRPALGWRSGISPSISSSSPTTSGSAGCSTWPT